MDFKVKFSAVVLLSFVVASASLTEDDIRRPQQSTLQVFQNAGRAYRIPEGVDFEEFFQEYMEKNTETDTINSPNYPNPYPVGANQIFPINSPNSTGLEIVVHVLDIDPLTDYIKLTPFDEDGMERKSIILTGGLEFPLKLRALGFTRMEITFGAWTSSEHSHKGFLLTYTPYGDIPPPGTPPPDVAVPFDDLDTVSKFLTIEGPRQTVETWNHLKKALCQSTDEFTRSTEPELDLCDPKNVTFTRISKCPSYWPNSADCVEMTFAVTLYYNRSLKPISDDPFIEANTPRLPAGLNTTQLNKMWNQYGKWSFEEANVHEYELPDARTKILMWISIVLGVIVVLFLALVTIFRAPVFKGRWIEEEKAPIPQVVNKSRADDDITMFPSPDQIIPDLFPGQAYGYQESGLSKAHGGQSNGAFSAVTEVTIEEEPSVAFANKG